MHGGRLWRKHFFLAQPSDKSDGQDRFWFTLARVGGVDLRAHLSWWLLLGLGSLFIVQLTHSVPGFALVHSWGLALGIALSLTLVVLIHEMGHCFVGARCGAEPVEIRMLWLGGATVYGAEPVGPGHKALSAGAGPAANCLVGSVSMIAAIALRDLIPWEFFMLFAAGNVGYALLNLMPVYPQDGGQLLYAVAWRLLGDEPLARELASATGLGLALIAFAVSVFFVTLVYPLSGILLAGQSIFLGLASYRTMIRARSQRLAATPVAISRFSPTINW